jgi:RNA-directed DNA polymerase
MIRGHCAYYGISGKDVDISKYFDTIDHAHLRQFLDQRVTDGVVRKMIDKWLKAGVLEKGILRRTSGGAPQGGVISPLLANIYLHYVLDEWFEKVAWPRLKGRCQLVRYADDAVMAFEDHLICAAAFVPSCSLNKTL